MQGARMLGNYVDYLSKQNSISHSDLAEVLGCSTHQAYSFIKGRVHISFSQISDLAQRLDTTVMDLLAGNEDVYKRTVVECMNAFDQDEHREEILDLIDNYIDLVDAVDDM